MDSRDGLVLQARQFGHVIGVSREIAIDAGLIEPTEQERAEAERARAEFDRRQAARAATLDAAREHLAALADPLARRILDLHAENEHGECDGCDSGMYAESGADWPCSTVDAVAAHYGIELP